jgi:TP901 family phage tail tape measure protein
MDRNYTIRVDIKAVSNFGKITKNLNKQLDTMQKRVDKVTKSSKANKAAMTGMDTAMSRLAFVAVPALVLGLRSIWKEGTRYEETVKNLSALTGITGDRLDGLTKKADQLSVKWGLASDNIVSGMKRIASNKSEFIEIEGAIEKVSDASAVLARASGLTFHKSGEVITQTMNQFNLGLEDSDRIINTFAVAAKLGSFEIDRLAQVMSRAGGMMKGMNLSFEDAMATAMIGSRLGLTGEMVGTQLKTALGRLGQQNDLFNPILQGFDKALLNLEKAGLSPKELMDIFGLESFQVAQALVNQADLFSQWKEEITGTNIAYIQAAVNMEAMNRRVDILIQRFKLIKRDWFFNEKTQTQLDKALDSIESILTQSTWQVRLLTKAFAGLGIAIGTSLLVFGSTKFIKSITMLVNAFKYIAGLQFFTKIGGLLSKLPVVGQMFSAGFRVAVGWVALIAVAITDIWMTGKAMFDSFANVGDLMIEQFSSGQIQEAFKTIGKAFWSGFMVGSLKFTEMLLDPILRVADFMGSIRFGKDWGASLREEMHKEFAGHVSDMQNWNNTDAAQTAKANALFLDGYLDRNPAMKEEMKNGRVEITVGTDANGSPTAIVKDVNGPVDVNNGNTSIGAPLGTPTINMPYGYGY